MRYLLCAVFLASSVFSQTIVEIEVRGNNFVDKSLITASSGLAVGKDLSTYSIRDAVKKIYSLGLFRDILIKTEQKGEGARIVIEVEEYKRVSEVLFIGNKAIKDKELREICGIKEGNIASDRSIFNARVAISDKYKEKGRFLIEIEPKTETTEEGVIVRFFVTERENLRIKEIDIIGNDAFPDRVIEMKMANREKTWYRKAVFNADKFEKDKENIIDFYSENGFPNAEIKNIEFVDLGRDWIRIELTIDEGNKLYFGDVSFSGNEIIPQERLHRYIKFKKGDIYNTGKLQESLQKIYEAYGDMGYLFLNVDLEEKVLDSIVDVKITVEENNPAVVRHIWIKGNTKTHEKVIRRELTIFPSDVLKRNELIHSQRKVFNLGFFGNLTLDTRVISDSGDIDLTFNVEEKEAGQFSIGVGYSGETSLTGNASVSIPNLRGLGELLYVKGDRGGEFANYEIGFREPWLFDTPTSAGIHIFQLRRVLSYYTDERSGGRFEVTRPIPGLPYTRGYFDYGLERVIVKADEGVPSSVKDEEGKRWKSAVTLGVTRDSRDNFLNPKEGSRNSLTTELAGIFGDERYKKYIFESQVYNRLPARFSTLLRGKFGMITPEDSPTYERFLLGGVGSWGLRGYGDLSIGIPSGDRVIGGRYALLFTVEAKIVFEQNIYPIVFLEMGNTWDSLEEMNLYKLKKGAGFGIRMEIPMMGLIGFDFAYGEIGWVPHFQVGKEF